MTFRQKNRGRRRLLKITVPNQCAKIELESKALRDRFLTY